MSPKARFKHVLRSFVSSARKLGGVYLSNPFMKADSSSRVLHSRLRFIIIIDVPRVEWSGFTSTRVDPIPCSDMKPGFHGGRNTVTNASVSIHLEIYLRIDRFLVTHVGVSGEGLLGMTLTFVGRSRVVHGQVETVTKDC